MTKKHKKNITREWKAKREATRQVNKTQWEGRKPVIQTKYHCTVCKQWLPFNCYYGSPNDRLVCGHCRNGQP